MNLTTIRAIVLRDRAAYGLLFLLSAIFLFGIRLAVPDHLTLYLKPSSTDFAQVFLPTSSGYIEEVSWRSPLIRAAASSRFDIPIQARYFSHLRLDPGNQPGDMTIERIEVRSMFGTRTWLPPELLAVAKPVQMVALLGLNGDGVLVRSNGNDPALELQIGTPSLWLQGGTIALLAAGLAAVLLRVVRWRPGLFARRTGSLLTLLGIPLLLSGAVAALFYPGFMSYDTLHALYSARRGVTDSMWPPMVSYVWRVVDWISPDPAAMHFSQLYLLFLALFFCVYVFGRSLWGATVFLCLYISVPVILGTLAVIWKDVLTAAFLLAGFALTLAMQRVQNKFVFRLAALLALLALFVGTCCRHNAITGAVPLIFYLAWVVSCRECGNEGLRAGKIATLLGGLAIAGVFNTKVFLDNYSLPGVIPMASSSGEFIRTVRALDIAGASVCAGENLFAETAPDLTVAQIAKLYDARHINLSKGLLDQIDYKKAPGIDAIWRGTALRHPFCFLSNKYELTKYMTGANAGQQFILTAPAIDDNEYGYRLADSPWRDRAVAYLIQKSSWTIFRPWFIYLLALAAFVVLILKRAATPAHTAVFLSGLFYFGGLVVFGNAADARLLFYTTTVACLVVAGFILDFLKGRT